MTVTTHGRDHEARSFARRFLGALRAATQAYAPSTLEGWYSDYAVGFAARHVGLAMAVARQRHAFRWSSKWPLDEDVDALIMEIVPDSLGLERKRFKDAHERAVAGQKNSDNYHPVNLGAGTAHSVLCVSLARMRASFRMDYFGVRIAEFDKDLRKLRAPTPMGRLTGYRSATLIYRYMVMRTLGETVFGTTTNQATLFAQTYQQPEKNGTDAKPS